MRGHKTCSEYGTIMCMHTCATCGTYKGGRVRRGLGEEGARIGHLCEPAGQALRVHHAAKAHLVPPQLRALEKFPR